MSSLLMDTKFKKLFAIQFAKVRLLHFAMAQRVCILMITEEWDKKKLIATFHLTNLRKGKIVRYKLRILTFFRLRILSLYKL